MFAYSVGNNSKGQKCIVIKKCLMCKHSFLDDIDDNVDVWLGRIFFHYHDTHGLTSRGELNEQVSNTLLQVCQ